MRSEDERIAFILYDGPIINPYAPRADVLESVLDLKEMLLSGNLTPECQDQVRELIYRGEKRLGSPDRVV